MSYGKSPKMTFMFECLKRFCPEVPAAGSSSESSTGAAEGASSWDSGEANSREQWPPQYPLLPAYRVIVRACQSFSTCWHIQEIKLNQAAKDSEDKVSKGNCAFLDKIRHGFAFWGRGFQSTGTSFCSQAYYGLVVLVLRITSNYWPVTKICL